MKEKKEKFNVFKSTLFRDSMMGNKRYFVLGILAVAFAAITYFAGPLVIGFNADYILLGQETQIPAFILNLFTLQSREYYLNHLWVIALFYLAIISTHALFVYLRGRWLNIGSEKNAQQMREQLYAHLQNVPYDYHKHTSTGDLVQRCTSDVDTIRRFLSTQFMEIVRTIVMVAIAVVVMISISPKLTLISLISTPILFLISFIYFKNVQKQFELSDVAEGALSTYVQENAAGVRVVRAFGQQQSEVDGFEEKNKSYRDTTYKLIKMLGIFWGSTDPVAAGQTILTLVVCTVMAARGEISIGTMIIFGTYTGMVVWPVRQLGRVLADFGKSVVSLKRLQEIMDVPMETENGRALEPDIKGDISFRDVTFGYDYPDEVLKGISFDVKAGQTVAILGATGSGKSSLVHLLQRLYYCTGGSITVDGIDVNDIERHHLRKNIGIVLQEPFLYSRSILENIRITDPKATNETVFESARIAAIHEVIESFDEGYQTLVGERGVTLSGGQKQRVAIARMLMQDAKILVFDDSMSAVDTETDTAIRDALSLRRKDITTFIISHRITTLCEADFILVLENGRIVQQGTHEELMAVPGLYSKIAEIQTMDAEEGGEE